MGIEFPSEEMGLIASWESSLKNGDLSSVENIERIERQILREATDKTKDAASRIFVALERKKEPLIEREIEVLKGASSKIEPLTHLMGYLPPEEIDNYIGEIAFEASLEEDPKVQAAVEHLLFIKKKPLILDLDLFIQEANDIADLVEKSDSFSPLKYLNPRQMAEVGRYL
jgi:hypothetical protein